MDRDSIEKFMEVTGESEATAIQYLTLAEGNVENAILLVFEGNGPVGRDAAIVDEPEVRAPILPTQEILVPTEAVCPYPRSSNGVFDRFRDFSVEIRRQEEEMTRQASGVMTNYTHNRTKRLEDLFRPPYDILFMGSFAEARDHAKSINRWLLVNVQNSQEFSCQILNRDVWSNKQIKEIIKDHFVLWQVLSDTSDGRRYIDFYNVMEYPYLAVVDPRTGERMRSYNHITVDLLLTGLNDILSSQPSPDSSSDSPNVEESHCEPSSSTKRGVYLNSKDSGRKIKKSRATDLTSSVGCSNRNGDTFATNKSTGNSQIIRGKRSRIEIPEELGDSPSNEAAMPTKEDSVAKSSNNVPETSSNRLEIPSGEPSLRLCLRLPSGGKEAVSMCANDTIETFIKRIEEMGFPRTEHTYLIPFPKTNVGALPSHTRLYDTILYPSNTVFITKALNTAIHFSKLPAY